MRANSNEPQFDRFAADYERTLARAVAISGESAEYFADYKARYVRRILGDQFRGRLLDYGCGVGLLAKSLHRHIPLARIDGFDVSRESIARVPPELLDRGTFTSDPASLSPACDVVVLANVLHHVPVPERPALLRELHARLAPRGRLVIFEHNPLNPLTRWSVAHCPFDDDAVLLWPSELRRHLERAGLRLARQDYIVFFPAFLARLRPLEPAMGWLPFGAQYATVAVSGV